MSLRFLPVLLCGVFSFAQQPPPDDLAKYTVVVTGTFAPVPLEDTNRSVEILPIGHEHTLFASFADVLKDDASIDLRQRGPGDVQGDLSIRGGTFAQSLVLLNGLRLNDAQSSHHNLDLPLPLEAMTEVQVLHGSGSTQYGSDAVTGVVNIIAKPEGTELRVRAALGNFGVNQESIDLAGGGAKFNGALFLVRDFSSGFEPDRDYRNLFETGILHGATALGNTDILLSMSDRPFGADQYYGNFDSWERTKGWFASMRQELGANTEVDFAFRRHTDLFVLFRDNPEIFTNRHALESWEGDLRRKQDFHSAGRLFYGIETYADSIISNNLGNHSRIHEAGYVAYEGIWRKRFSLSAGVRDEVHGSFNNEVSPTIAAGVWISEKWKLRASASHAFRLPTYTDLYYHDPANLGSPNLRPERAWNFDGGVDWNAAPHIRAELTVFERRVRDLIDYVRTSATDIFRATNFQQLNFTGVEASVHLRAAQSQMFSVQYTGLSGDRSLARGVISQYVFNYPVNSGIVSWQGALGRRLAARTRIGVLDRVGRSPYAIWDASVVRADGRFRPFIQFTNLTNAVYQEIVGVAMPKRGVIGAVEWKLL